MMIPSIYQDVQDFTWFSNLSIASPTELVLPKCSYQDLHMYLIHIGYLICLVHEFPCTYKWYIGNLRLQKFATIHLPRLYCTCYACTVLTSPSSHPASGHFRSHQ